MSNIHFGEVLGIKEGQKFVSRKALIEAGLHRSIQHGIDGNGNEGVAAIVVSGGYEDDRDFGDEIIYTGHGGNNPTTKNNP
jgi:putative restriction endonuclease